MSNSLIGTVEWLSVLSNANLDDIGISKRQRKLVAQELVNRYLIVSQLDDIAKISSNAYSALNDIFTRVNNKLSNLRLDDADQTNTDMKEAISWNIASRFIFRVK